MSNKESIKPFTDGQLQSISKAIGNTEIGLTGNEIGHVLVNMKLRDTDSNATKWKRIYNALADYQNNKKTGDIVLTFISKSLEPTKFINKSDKYHEIIENLNKALVFIGLEFKEDGKFYKVKIARTLSEAEMRANALKQKLKNRNVHPYVMEYCRSELLVNNCFHAVLEATKSIASKIREITGLTADGAGLIDEAFSGSNPRIKINSFDTESKKSEQRGFVNLAKGLFGTFRNPTAHSAKLEWNLSDEDALDLFVLASYIIRRIENRA